MTKWQRWKMDVMRSWIHSPICFVKAANLKRAITSTIIGICWNIPMVKMSSAPTAVMSLEHSLKRSVSFSANTALAQACNHNRCFSYPIYLSLRLFLYEFFNESFKLITSNSAASFFFMYPPTYCCYIFFFLNLIYVKREMPNNKLEVKVRVGSQRRIHGSFVPTVSKLQLHSYNIIVTSQSILCCLVIWVPHILNLWTYLWRLSIKYWQT